MREISVGLGLIVVVALTALAVVTVAQKKPAQPPVAECQPDPSTLVNLIEDLDEAARFTAQPSRLQAVAASDVDRIAQALRAAVTACPPPDPSLDWVRALNNLHSRIDQLESKIDARPLFIHDSETEELHRRLLTRPFPSYQGTINQQIVVLRPTP